LNLYWCGGRNLCASVVVRVEWLVEVPEQCVTSISVDERGLETILDDIGVSKDVANDVSLDVRVSLLPGPTFENLDNWDLSK
jgi:hypothetical protein